MNNTFYQELAQIVRFHRKKSGLNQIELAKLAGVGKAAIFDIEQGKKTVQLNTLIKVLNILNIKCELTSSLMNAYREEYHETR